MLYAPWAQLRRGAQRPHYYHYYYYYYFFVYVKARSKPLHVFILCVALSLHYEAERKQHSTMGKEAAWKSDGVSLVHVCPKLNEGTGSAAEHWAEVVDWTAGLH